MVKKYFGKASIYKKEYKYAYIYMYKLDVSLHQSSFMKT